MADETQEELTAPARMPTGAKPRFETPLVPRNSISGSALIAVVAIMTFLASLTTGAVMLVNQAASEWQADVAREVTIQVLPAPGRDVDATVAKAAAVTRAFAGIGDVRVYTKEESAKLLEPWLGQRAFTRRSAGAAPDRGQDRRRRDARYSAVAPAAGRAGAGRGARRSPRLGRPDARDGRHRGSRRHRRAVADVCRGPFSR